MKNLVSERLVEIRKEHKLTRKDLENISGFNFLTIGGYERGSRTPSSDYISFICLYFGYRKNYVENIQEKTAKVRVKSPNGKDVILIPNEKYLNKAVKIILMYQSIFDYKDEKMAELLKISLLRYRNVVNLNAYNIPSETICEISIDEISKRLNIKRNCFIDFIDLPTRKILASDYSLLDITPDYYASIIKKRNKPETITPLNIPDNIPPKHQELLNLLRFAPESFTDEIIAKLKAMQELQNL